MKHNNLISEITLEEQFKKDCKFINLTYEYLGYTGNEEWAIISELSKCELLEKYSEQVEMYIPFIYLSVEQGEAICAYNRNEDKCRKRSQNNEYGFDDITEYAHPELIQPDFIEASDRDAIYIERTQMKMQLLSEGMDCLTEKQRKCMMLRFVEGMSARDIAKEAGITHQAVEKHINAAKRKMEKVFKDFF